MASKDIVLDIPGVRRVRGSDVPLGFHLVSPDKDGDFLPVNPSQRRRSRPPREIDPRSILARISGSAKKE